MALIKTDDFFEALGWAHVDVYEAYGDDYGLWGFTLDSIRGALSEVPEIDPIHYAGGCYCRECEDWRPYTDDVDGKRGRCRMGRLKFEDDFCSCGTKREVDQ